MVIPTPWPTLNKVGAAFGPGDLYSVVGARHSGKTWLILAWAEHVAQVLGSDASVLFISLEMPRHHTYRRLSAIRHKIDFIKTRNGEVAIPATSTPTILIEDSNAVRTVKDIAKLVAARRPKAVFVDNIYILGRANGKPITARTEENARTLRESVAKEFNLPMVVSSQLTREAAMKNAEKDRRVNAIAKFSDATFGIFTPDDKAKPERVLRTLQAREFTAVDLQINFDLTKMDFSEIEQL